MPLESIQTLLLAIVLSGAFGGLVFGIFTKNQYKIRVPFKGNLLEIGFIGDLMVGSAASITIFFVAGPLFNFNINNITTNDCFVKVIALGVLSGFTGIRLMTGMSSKLLEKISSLDQRVEQVEKHDKIAELLREADLLVNNNPSQALGIYEKAIAIDSSHESALIGKAKSFARLDRLDEAIKILTDILHSNPKCERAYYNRACYKNLSKSYSKEEALVDLQEAISLFDFYKQYAQEDKDFKSLLSDEDFKKLIS